MRHLKTRMCLFFLPLTLICSHHLFTFSAIDVGIALPAFFLLFSPLLRLLAQIAFLLPSRWCLFVFKMFELSSMHALLVSWHSPTFACTSRSCPGLKPSAFPCKIFYCAFFPVYLMSSADKMLQICCCWQAYQRCTPWLLKAAFLLTPRWWVWHLFRPACLATDWRPHIVPPFAKLAAKAWP